MKLPFSLENSKEWTLVGAMGPQLPEALLSHPILCVDGGAHFSSRMDLWIGDSDSYQDAVKCEHIFKFPAQKSSSDLALALGFFEASGPFTLHLWGFLGGRIDHELFNLGETMAFLERSPDSQIIFYEGNGKAGPLTVRFKMFGAGEKKFTHHGPFSLASMKDISLTLTGDCLYKIERPTKLSPLSSFGLSNVANGEITVKAQGAFMLIFSEDHP